MRGTSSFASGFARQGPSDRRGRSLRELDLKTRLLRYPLSFLIYSDAFNALPQPARDHVWRRLWDTLNGQEFAAALTPQGPTAASEIVLETAQRVPIANTAALPVVTW